MSLFYGHVDAFERRVEDRFNLTQSPDSSIVQTEIQQVREELRATILIPLMIPMPAVTTLVLELFTDEPVA